MGRDRRRKKERGEKGLREGRRKKHRASRRKKIRKRKRKRKRERSVFWHTEPEGLGRVRADYSFSACTHMRESAHHTKACLKASCVLLSNDGSQ